MDFLQWQGQQDSFITRTGLTADQTSRRGRSSLAPQTGSVSQRWDIYNTGTLECNTDTLEYNIDTIE